MRNLLVVLLTGLLWASPVFAQDNDIDNTTWPSGKEMTLTNCSAAPINAAVICGGTRGMRVSGYNALTLEITYTQSAGTGYEFYLETCYEGQTTSDCTDAADWHRVATEWVAPGLVLLNAGKITHAAAASDQSTWTIGINYRRIRLAAFVATGAPDAGDKITVRARAGWLPHL